jgi:hypothetical protein
MDFLWIFQHVGDRRTDVFYGGFSIYLLDVTGRVFFRGKKNSRVLQDCEYARFLRYKSSESKVQSVSL